MKEGGNHQLYFLPTNTCCMVGHHNAILMLPIALFIFTGAALFLRRWALVCIEIDRILFIALIALVVVLVLLVVC
jgi:hypothetical protein